MKIKLSKLIYFSIFLIVILEHHIFYWFPYPEKFLYGAFFRIEVAMWALFLCLVIYIRNRERKVISSNYLGFMLFGSIVSVVMTSIHSIFEYPAQGIFDTIGQSFRFLWIFLAYPILYYAKVIDNGFQKLINMLNVIAFIWMITIMIQTISYNITGTFLFNFQNYFYSDNITRNGVRISLSSCFGTFFVLYNTLALLAKNDEGGMSKKYSVVFVAIGWPLLFLVQQTRTQSFLSIVCLVVMIIYKSHLTKRQLLLVIAFVVIALYAIQSGVVSTFFGSFSSTGKDANSTVSRLGASEYYWSIFVENPLWALGFAHITYYFNLIRGPFGLYYLNDVGIFGTIAQLGIFIIPIYVIPVIRMIYIWVKCKKRLSEFDGKLLLMCIIYLFGTTPTLIITDIGRIIFWPIMVALFEYIYMKSTEASNSAITHAHLE